MKVVWRHVGALGGAAVLQALAGCTIVAGLGEPKGLETGPGGDADIDADLDAAGDVDGSVPSDGSGLEPVGLAVGGTHACAIVQGKPGDERNGTVECWGSNVAGELGADPKSMQYSAVPRPIAAGMGVSDVVGLALSTGYSCAITASGYLLCWGAVPDELPEGVHREQPVPSYDPSFVDLANDVLVGVSAVSAGPQGGAIGTQGGGLACWGAATYQLRDGGSGGFDGGVVLGEFSSAAVGRAHACAITGASGASWVECWGDNSHGQVGIPSQGVPSVPYPTPVDLSALNGASIKSLGLGSDHTCVLTGVGTVWCWGRNDLGQLGNSVVGGDSSTPTQVQLGSGTFAEELAVGDQHACVATSANTVHCWGDNSAGQLGVGSKPLFQAMATQKVMGPGSVTLRNVAHVAAGGQTTCSTITGDPRVWCWGANQWGQGGQVPSAKDGGAPLFYAAPVSL